MYWVAGTLIVASLIALSVLEEVIFRRKEDDIKDRASKWKEWLNNRHAHPW